MGNGEGAQCLGGHLPGIGEHGQLPPPGADHLATDKDDIAEVDIGFPGIQRLRANPGQADHCLQLGAVALLQGGKTQLAGVAGEHHAARQPDANTGGGVGWQIGVGGANLGQRVGPRHEYRIGLTALVQQMLSFVLPDPKLLGNIIGGWMFGLDGLRCFRFTHGVPA